MRRKFCHHVRTREREREAEMAMKEEERMERGRRDNEGSTLRGGRHKKEEEEVRRKCNNQSWVNMSPTYLKIFKKSCFKKVVDFLMT